VFVWLAGQGKIRCQKLFPKHQRNHPTAVVKHEPVLHLYESCSATLAKGGSTQRLSQTWVFPETKFLAMKSPDFKRIQSLAEYAQPVLQHPHRKNLSTNITSIGRS